MTDILCKWLNNELGISSKVDEINFDREFASGYLVGEVLKLYQLQNDFDQFSQSRTADSKLNNFTRLEPVLHLLGIPFDTNVARDMMTEKHGVATSLMYQLYIALNNKKKANLTGVAMETMKPAAPAKLNAIESGIYKERLKHLTPRQTDLNLEALVERFHEKQIEMEKTAFKERFLEEERIREQQMDQRQYLMERARQMKAQQSELIAKIQAASVMIPKPPPNKSAKALQVRKQIRRKQEAQDTMDAISAFEDRMKMTVSQSSIDDENEIDVEYIVGREDEKSLLDSVDLIKPKSNSEYINKIKRRLEEDSAARAEREKRRRKVVVDQMTAHEAQEEAHREEMLVNRLMRQSQQERRIAVQLLQARHEKEVIRKNRTLREKEYEERRLKDFEDALNREAELTRLAKEEYEEQTRQDQELHDRIAAERAEERYRKHYDQNMEIVNQIVDFSCKFGEYRELTDRLVPAKLMREWKALFVSGNPLYEVTGVTESAEPTPEQILEEERQQLLDEGDFLEYKNMVGEWQPGEGCEIAEPPKDNPIVGHIVQRLFNLVHPPSPPPVPPEFPPFPIRACVLGKVFSGKTTCVRKLAEEHRLEVLDAEKLVDAAIEAYKDGEEEEEVEESEGKITELLSDGHVSSPRDASTPESRLISPAGEELSKPSTANSVDEGLAQDSELPPTPASLSDEKREELSESPVKSITPSKKSSREKEKTPKPQLSVRAKLGAKAIKCLKRGKPIEEQIIVDVIVEAIRSLSEGTGWVLDGFPSTYPQAKLLEKALSGHDANAKEAKKQDKSGKKKSSLVPDPRPTPSPAEPASGIDVVVMFDVPDELCLKRAAGRTYATQSDQMYHQEFKPPPEGSATGVGKQEQVMPVEDAAHDEAQIQHRITGFLDSWPKLEKWFNRFGTLKKVDAIADEQTVYLETEKIFEDTVAKIQGKDTESTTPQETDIIEEKTETVPPPAEVVIEIPKEEPTESRPASRKASRDGSAKKSGSRASSKESRSKSPKTGKKDKDKRVASESPKRGSSGKKSEAGKKGSRGASPKSPKRGKSGKKSKTPDEPEPEPEPEVPTGPPPPQPGSEEWEFADEPVEMDLAKILAQHWESVEESYVANNKNMFRKIRDERENIYRYFFQIRKDFLSYLRRPDHKQEFIEQWQKEYNEVPDDMRDDEETKSEMHQRVNDLRERLWNICDERKEQAESERETVMNDGWLDDRFGVLSNFYITIMQSEVDRYQDTIRLMKDYYKGMEGQIPDNLDVNYSRLPLIELPADRPESPEKPPSEVAPTPPATEEPPGTAKSDRSKSPKERQKSPKESRSKSPKDSKSPRSKSRTPSGKKRDKSKEKDKPVEQAPQTSEADLHLRIKIPLVPRRPQSPDADGKTAAAKDKKDKKGKKDDGVESPVPPTDPDERLIFDAFLTGIHAIAQILATEMAVKEAEEEAERQREKELENQKEKEKAAGNKKKDKGGKKGKSRSPSPKKKKEVEVPSATPPVSEAESELEKQKKQTRDRMKQEYYFSVQLEEGACKKRLELIKYTAICILQDLRKKADGAFNDMNDWLGARFLKEIESIDQLSELMRHGIESKERIKQELALKQEDLFLNEDLLVLRTPSPPLQPPPVEQPMGEQFTVAQILAVHNQFKACAPTGVMSNKSFVETFENFVSVSFGMEQLPDCWMSVTQAQIQEISNGLSADSEYVDWRRFLLAIAQPIPTPIQSQLLETLQRFKDMDQKNTGCVTREQYDRMDLWFSTEPEETEEEEEEEEPRTYNRMSNLKKALFDIFADFNRNPPQLDYNSMLLYFSAAPNSMEGFLRALSVATGTHMPRPSKPATPVLERTMTGASIIEETAEVLYEPLKTPEPSYLQEDIPAEAANAKVSLEALYQVLHHGESTKGDSHRFSVAADPEEATSKEKLASVYKELGNDSLEPIMYKLLIEHPLIQDVVAACHTYKALDIKAVLSNPHPDNTDAHSTKTMD